jgi:geranylgeranylglycerol-phosphate geranylgeranyltransferase
MILWEAVLLVYAMRAKRLPLVGNLLVSAVASSAFLVGALASENPRAVTFPIIFAFLFFMGRELVKGAEDIQGDRTAGARTMAVRIGVEKTVFFASCLFLICVVLAPLPVLLERYGRFYALVMELIVVPGLVMAVYLVLNRPRRVILNRVNWLLKIEMFFGIVAMGLGKT